MQVRYPDRITLIRGNHESRQITQVCLLYDIHQCDRDHPAHLQVWPYRSMASMMSALENMAQSMFGGTALMYLTTSGKHAMQSKLVMTACVLLHLSHNCCVLHTACQPWWTTGFFVCTVASHQPFQLSIRYVMLCAVSYIVEICMGSCICTAESS